MAMAMIDDDGGDDDGDGDDDGGDDDGDDADGGDDDDDLFEARGDPHSPSKDFEA